MGAAAGVYDALFNAGYEFDFFQAVRLLERFFPDAPPPGESADVRTERIRFRPHAGLVFPATDVKRVNHAEAGAAEVVVTFMGLYGVDTPLPSYFHEELTSEEPETMPLRDFLDIFNHRLYSFFYRAWKKYRPGSGAAKEAHTARFLALAGLGTQGALADAPMPGIRLAALAGRLSGRVRNAEGLRSLLTTYLGVAVGVIENMLRRVPIPQRPRLGGGAVLGDTTTIGATVADRSGAFRLVLGPLSYAEYETFLPGASGARLLDYLVHLYAPDYLAYDVELLINTDEIPVAKAGNRTTRLGVNMWLDRPDGGVTTQVVSYA